METYSPFIISARLLPAVDVAGATVSVDPTSNRDHYGKPEWRYFIDLPDGTEHTGGELYGWGDAGEMLETLLAFLGACGESVNYRDRTGRGGENADIFPPEVAAWCAANSDALSVASFECEEANRARRE